MKNELPYLAESVEELLNGKEKLEIFGFAGRPLRELSIGFLTKNGFKFRSKKIKTLLYNKLKRTAIGNEFANGMTLQISYNKDFAKENGFCMSFTNVMYEPVDNKKYILNFKK